MRDSKSTSSAENVVKGPFAGAADDIQEPDWLLKFSHGEWGKASAEIASVRWHSAVAEMRRLRRLGPENATTLEIMAKHYARWRLAEAHVAEFGPVVSAPRAGVPMRIRTSMSPMARRNEC